MAKCRVETKPINILDVSQISCERHSNLCDVDVVTYKLDHVPIKYVVVRVSMSMEQISKQLTEIAVVRFVIEP